MGDSADIDTGKLDTGKLDTGQVADTRARLLEAAARCVGRRGMTATTIDDIAVEAGSSRATVYRHFPGREELLAAMGAYEEGRLFAVLAPRLDAAATLDDALVVAICDATAFLQDNEVLARVLEHEPEKILPHIAFDRIGPLLYRATAFLAPHLERLVTPERVPEIAEWGTRLVLSHWLRPSPHLDLRDPVDARRLVTTYLLPGLEPGLRIPSKSSPITTE